MIFYSLLLNNQEPMNEKLIVAFESSCDDTSVALMRSNKTLLGYKTRSKPSTHQPHGGVVPELASRDHISFCMKLLKDLLFELEIDIDQIDIVAYTAGPGLIGSLLVSASVAAGLAIGLGAKLLPIHHLEGHLLSPFLSATLLFLLGNMYFFLSSLSDFAICLQDFIESGNNKHLVPL